MAHGDRSALKVLDAVLVVGGGVIAAVVAFALLHFVVGIVWFAVKAMVVLAVIGAIGWLLLRRRT